MKISTASLSQNAQSLLYTRDAFSSSPLVSTTSTAGVAAVVVCFGGGATVCFGSVVVVMGITFLARGSSFLGRSGFSRVRWLSTMPASKKHTTMPPQTVQISHDEYGGGAAGAA